MYRCEGDIESGKLAETAKPFCVTMRAPATAPATTTTSQGARGLMMVEQRVTDGT